MKKLSSYAFVIVLSLGATAMLANSGQTPAPVQGSQAQLAADGAFRDGFYLGRLAAEGRWSAHASQYWPLVHRPGPFHVLGRVSPWI